MVINPIVGVYIPTIRIPIKGGMTISNIATFDHGTYEDICLGGCNFSPQTPTKPHHATPRSLGDLRFEKGRGETPVQLATRMGHVEVVKVDSGVVFCWSRWWKIP